MAENSTFQQQQRESYNEQVGTYIFTAEYPGAAIARSSELTVTKPGIKLYFLRHGLFDKDEREEPLHVSLPTTRKEQIAEATVLGPDNPLQEVMVKKFIEYPNVKNHYFAETAIRDGYIYIIFENDTIPWLEYKTVIGGGLKAIVWYEGSNVPGNDGFYDEREPDNTIIDSGVSVAHCEIVWIAFSSVQWSVTYHKKMRTDTKARAARMQRFETSGFQPNEEIEWAKSCNQVNGVFTKDNSNEARWLQYRLEQVQLEDDAPEIKEDMFLILQDPIGFTEDIGFNLEKEFQWLDAITESMQTGQDHAAIYERIRNGNPYRTAPLSDYEAQINALFSYSLAVYQTLYNNNDIIEKFGDTTDKQKIEMILGVEIRKKQRDRILNLRDDFGMCQQSDGYQGQLTDYYENTQDGIFDGYELQQQHLSLLAIHPQYKDYEYDLRHRHTYHEDGCAEYFKKILNKDECLVTTKLLMAGVDVADLSTKTLSAGHHLKIDTRLAKSLKGIMEAFAKYATDKVTYTATLDYLKAITVKGEPFFQFRKTELDGKIPSGIGLNLKMVERIEGRKNSVFALIRSSQSREAMKEAVVNKKLELTLERVPSNIANKVTKVLASPHFRVFILGLELLNLSAKLNGYQFKKPGLEEVNIAGALAKSLSAGRAFQEAVLIKRGADAIKLGETGLSKWGKGLGVLGSSVTVAMCVVDSIKSYKHKDYDASAVWLATSAMAAVTVINSGLVFYSKYIVKGAGKKLPTWQVITANALFFTGLVIAIYLTDTPLEKFLKNNALNGDTPVEGGQGLYPSAYAYLIYEQRYTLIGKECTEWADFELASKDLCDLMMTYRLERMVILKEWPFDPKYKERSRFGKWKEQKFIELDGIKHLKKFVVKVYLRKFLYNISKFEHELYFFPKGLDTKKSKLFISCQKMEIEEENNQDVLVLHYKLTTAQFNTISAPPHQSQSSMFMLVSRSIIDEEHEEYYPSQREKNTYHGFIFRADDLEEGTVFRAMEDALKPVTGIYGLNVQIGTHKELIGTEI